MKKILLAISISIVSIFMFCCVETKEFPKSDEYIVGICRNFKKTDVENMKRIIFSANAKTSDKYRLTVIFTSLKNNSESFDSRKASSVLDRFFSRSDGVTSDDFLELCRGLYRDMTTVKVEHAVTGVGARPDLSIPQKVLCKTLTGKYAVSCDGTEWMYSSNYIAAFYGEKCALVLRSPRGMAQREGFPDLSQIMKSKEFFECGRGYKANNIIEDGDMAAVSFSGKYGDILCYSKRGLSSPLMYDFSSFSKKQKNVVENNG